MRNLHNANLNELCCEWVDSRSGMWESLMRLTVLSSEACEDSSGFLCIRGMDVAIMAAPIADDDEGGLSLLVSLDGILVQILSQHHFHRFTTIF